MGAKTRLKLTNFSKGELSPRLAGRDDLAAYSEGGRTVENFDVLRQGGVTRRLGTRFIAESDPDKKVVLIPFDPEVGISRVVEAGEGFMRFFGDKQRIMNGAVPVQIASPYTGAQLPFVHFTQSVDVMTLFHEDVPQHALSRISDTEWTLVPEVYNPPPVFEADFDVSEGTATLTPDATTGSGINFTRSTGTFLDADIGRYIIATPGKALITSVIGNIATTSITEAFANTNPIPVGQWKLRESPKADLIPPPTGPAGVTVGLLADRTTWRPYDVGKYISILGGLVQITNVVSQQEVHGVVIRSLADSTEPGPPPVPAGAWTLNVPSWSAEFGFPRTGEYVNGRKMQASTRRQPTTFWLSRADDYSNYAVGIAADDAVSQTLATRQLNRIEWVAEIKDVFIGTSGTEHRLLSGKEGESIGGDKIPTARHIDDNGSMPIQAIVYGNRVIFVDRSTKRIHAISFDLEQDEYSPLEITAFAEHITGTGIAMGPIAVVRQPEPRLYFVRSDGSMVVLLFNPQEKVVAFSRYVTDGRILSAAATTQRDGNPDQLWVLVERLVGGQARRYIELADTEVNELIGRPWNYMMTDCGKAYALGGIATRVFTGLEHLEGRVVAVIADGGYRGDFTVIGGAVTLQEDYFDHAEVGLKYASILQTMKPSIQGRSIAGLYRSWISFTVELQNTIGGVIGTVRQQEPLQYRPQPLGSSRLFTGERKCRGEGGSEDESIIIVQDQPYPITVLAIAGELEVGDAA